MCIFVPRYNENWPLGWGDERIARAVEAAGAIQDGPRRLDCAEGNKLRCADPEYLDRRIEASCPPDGAIVNKAKTTVGPKKSLCPNDLVEGLVLAKKAGARTIATCGKTAGFASNEYDRLRTVFSACRSAVECGFSDFALSAISMFTMCLATQLAFARHLEDATTLTRESSALVARLRYILSGGAILPYIRKDRMAVLLAFRPGV